MKKAQLKELIKQSMSEFNDPEYLELMKKADDTGRGYAERDEFRNKAWDLKRAKTGAMTPDEERMVSDYEEEEANKYALDSENPLEESRSNSGLMVIGKTKLDNNAIGDAMEEEGLHAEWNAREGYWFFPEEEDMYDELENQLSDLFNRKGINARFEGVFSESLEELISKTDRIITEWVNKK